MSNKRYLLLAAVLSLAFASAAMAGKTRNVVLIVCDGLRPEEMFTGAEAALLDAKNGGNWMSEQELRARFWDDDPNVRRMRLFPFIWGTVARQGQLLGNALEGSQAQVANGLAFSYPGYNEMASGIPDPRINSNEFGPESQSDRIRVAVGPAGIQEQGRDLRHLGNLSRYFQRAPAVTCRSARAQRWWTRATTVRAANYSRICTRPRRRLEGTDPYDSFLTVSVLDHLRTHRPRVMFVGFGDTDSWAHRRPLRSGARDGPQL